MITRAEIKSCSNQRFYARGRDLYEQGKVYQIDVEDGDDLEYVEAEVKGSGRNMYHVILEIENEEYIYSYRCSCPAAHSYPAMCKHGVAVALEYMSYQKHNSVQMDFWKKQQDSLESLKGIQKGIKLQTTPKLKELLTKYTEQKILPMLEQHTYGQVELEPILTLDLIGRDVEFKIGAEKKYVLKDVFELIKNVEEHKNYAYGKQLEFVHMPEAFSATSRPLLEFIRKWTKKYQAQYTQPLYYGSYYSYGTPKVRNMSLTDEDLEDLFLAIGEQEFTANIMGSGEKAWRVTREPVPYQIHLKGEGNGLSIGMLNLHLLKGKKYYMAFRDGNVHLLDAVQWGAAMEFLKCMNDIPGDGFIEQADISSFCNNLLPQLAECFEIATENFTPETYIMPKPTFQIYLDAPQKFMITFKVVAGYGNKNYNVYGDTDIDIRNLAEERMITAFVEPMCNAFDPEQKLMVISEDEERIYQLLTEGIEQLKQIAEVYVSDALKRMQVVQAPRTTVGVSLSGDLLELKISSGDISMDELVGLLSRYSRRRKYYRLKNGNILHVENDSMQQLAELKDSLQLTERELAKGKVKLPKYRALYLDEQIADSEFIETQKSKSFYDLVANIQSTKDFAFAIPQSLEHILRGYQKEGFRWMKALYRNGFGGILADDMGLGKSLQVISFILSEMEEAKKKENKRTLIVCPASLVYNWKSEFEKFAPQLSVIMIVGTAEERKAAVAQSGTRDILVTSYDLLKRDIDNYDAIKFFCQIIDEAQYIKNSGTQAAKAVKLIQSGFRLALTGTPVENRLSELWSEFDYLMPGFLYSYQRFKEQMEQPIVKDNDEDTLVRLQKLIRPFVLRRLKSDVLKDLPDKVEENMYVQMEGEQQQLYDAHVKRMKMMLENTDDVEFKSNKIQILAELTKLRQMCCDPSILFENYQGASAKTDMCVDLIRRAVANGHKILLFSQFTTMLEHLQERLKKEKISFYTLTGATKKEKRAEMVEAFDKDDTSVFCISLKAGGTGLNLTAADIVIHYDPWWNVAVQNQATDRAHRIGQKNVVTVYKLITKDSIEENIEKLQAKKRELADKILGGEGISNAGFDREELLELLR